MFSFVNASSAIDLAQVLLELSIDSDEFLGDDFIFLVGIFDLGLEIVVACFLKAREGVHILREAFVDLFCLFMRHLESVFQILERVCLHGEETIGLGVVLHGLKPFFEMWLALNLSIIVKRCNLVRNACHHLLFEVLRYLRVIFIVKTRSKTILLRFWLEQSLGIFKHSSCL